MADISQVASDRRPWPHNGCIFPRGLAPAYQRFIDWKAFSEKASYLFGEMSGCAVTEVQLPGSGSLLGHGLTSKLQTPKKCRLFSLFFERTLSICISRYQGSSTLE